MMQPPPRWRRDVSLRELTSWRIGGPLAFLSHPSDLAELREDLLLAHTLGVPIFALGGGSNLLVSDAGYPGLMIRLPDAPPRFHAPQNQVLVRLSAGSSLARSARRVAEIGWGGLEWAEGIPGTIGGALVNNAGAFGGSVGEVVSAARLIDHTGQIETWPAARFAFGYRQSCLKGADPTSRLLLDVDLHLRRADPALLAGKLDEFRAARRRRTPRGASCGSVFRNPAGEVAGRLIAACGLAGRRRGDAQISTHHANYILNGGTACAADVLDLIRLCRRCVRETRGIELELEVQLIGFPPDFEL